MEKVNTNEFVAVCHELKNEIVSELEKVHNMPKEALSWVNDMVDYNCLGGKMNRGISVVQCTEAILKGKGEKMSEDMKKRAMVLGWCIEWLQAFFLVADDVMDESITRRGQPCWYRVPKVKQIAINDSFLLESFVFRILKNHFADDAFYMEVVELFRHVIFKTELGQLLDLTSQPMDAPANLDRFTIERYRSIVINKTAYYTFYLSVASAMHLTHVKSVDCFEIAQKICLEIGEYFQVQDDFLDCFGDPGVIGKVGTDIQDNKCSWLVVKALDVATMDQKTILKEHYGKSDNDSIQKVKDLYTSLDLQGEYANFESESYKSILSSINSLENMQPDVFHLLVNRIYKRTK